MTSKAGKAAAGGPGATAIPNGAGLPVRPYCDLGTLFAEHPPDPALDRQLFTRFAPGVLMKYCRAGGRADKVYYAPSGKRGQKAVAALLKAGLARSGRGLQPSELLNELKLSELNAMLAELGRAAVRTKSQAIEALSASPELEARLARVINREDYVVLEDLPPEVRQVPLRRIEARCRYYSLLSQLMLMDRLAGRAYANAVELARIDPSLTGWEITSPRDEHWCSACKRESLKLHGRENPPKIPFHVGCRCSIAPKTSRG